MTSDAVEQAEQRLDDFETTLREYDDPLVTRLADAIDESDVLDLQMPKFTIEEWLSVLETLAGAVYLSARHTNRTGLNDHETTWFMRHDGDAWVYGTENTGELYRGVDAERQIRAVIDAHDVYAHPMDVYPLDERGETA